MAGVIVAVLVGIGIAVQVRVLGSSSAKYHPLSVSLALQLAGVLVGLVWAAARNEWRALSAVLTSWWCIPLGVGGLLVVAALGFASSRIGVATTLGLSIAAQVAVGLTLDVANGSGDATVAGVLGVVLVIAGATLLTAS